MNIDFSEFQANLLQLSAAYDAAEWHGLLAGVLCTGVGITVEQWYALATDEPLNDPQRFAESSHLIFQELFQQTRSQLLDEEFSFQLLLPDEASLAKRVEALGGWCRGFLYGLSFAGLDKETSLPDNSAEFLADMVDLSNIGFDNEGPEADDEYNYNELVEYIRVGVLLMNTELTGQVVQNARRIH